MKKSSFEYRGESSRKWNISCHLYGSLFLCPCCLKFGTYNSIQSDFNPWQLSHKIAMVPLNLTLVAIFKVKSEYLFLAQILTVHNTVVWDTYMLYGFKSLKSFRSTYQHFFKISCPPCWKKNSKSFLLFTPLVLTSQILFQISFYNSPHIICNEFW